MNGQEAMLQGNTRAAPRVGPVIQAVSTDDENYSDVESESEGDCTFQFVDTNLVVELCLRQSQAVGQKGNSKKSSGKGARKPSGGKKWRKKGFSQKNSSKGGASTGRKLGAGSSGKGSGAIRPMTGKNRF